MLMRQAMGRMGPRGRGGGFMGRGPMTTPPPQMQMGGMQGAFSGPFAQQLRALMSAQGPGRQMPMQQMQPMQQPMQMGAGMFNPMAPFMGGMPGIGGMGGSPNMGAMPMSGSPGTSMPVGVAPGMGGQEQLMGPAHSGGYPAMSPFDPMDAITGMQQPSPRTLRY